MPFEARTEIEDSSSLLKYRFFRNEAPLSFAEVLDLWKSDGDFMAVFLSIFGESPHASYVWETPALSSQSLQRAFECVIIDAPYLLVPPDRSPFADYFDSEAIPEGIVTFANLGGDAHLVVPSPLSDAADYSHLAAFCRQAPLAQQLALWREVAAQVRARVCDRPLWLSVAGGGVAWLHVRLDRRPKYYSYRPYAAAG